MTIEDLVAKYREAPQSTDDKMDVDSDDEESKSH